MRYLGLLLLTVAVSLEVLAVALLEGGGDQLISAVGSHLAAAGLSAEGLALRTSDASPGAKLRPYLLGWFLALLFFPFGAAWCLFLTLRPGRRRAHWSWRECLEAKRTTAAQAALDLKRRQQQIGAGIDAIVDALRDRDSAVRLAGMEALRDVHPREAVKILSQNRDNTLFDVRVRVAESLGRISKHYSGRIQAARESWQKNPASPDTNRELAALLLEYSELGLESQEMSSVLVEQAARHAQAAFSSGPDLQAALTLGRALRRIGQLEDAIEAYRWVIAEEGFHAGAFVGLAEAQLSKQDFPALRHTCRWAIHNGGRQLDPEVVEALRLWLLDPRPAPRRT